MSDTTEARARLLEQVDRLIYRLDRAGDVQATTVIRALLAEVEELDRVSAVVGSGNRAAAEQAETGPVAVRLDAEQPTEPGWYLCNLFNTHLVYVYWLTEGGSLVCSHPNYVTLLPVRHEDARWSRPIRIEVQP